MSLAVYAFFDGSNCQRKIDSDDYVWNGTWSAATSYFAVPLDVVEYSGARYIAIRDNTNFAPLRTPPYGQNEVWSILSKIQEGDEPPWPLPDTTQVALETAWTGTALATQALHTGTEALYAAWDGTARAEEAYTLAATGTALAQEALDTSVSKSGDTMTGPLVVPTVHLGLTGSVAVGGTLTVDMNYRGFVTHTLTGNTHIVPVNQAGGRSAFLMLTHDSVDRVITFPTEVQVLGGCGFNGTVDAGGVSETTFRAYGTDHANVLISVLQT